MERPHGTRNEGDGKDRAQGGPAAAPAMRSGELIVFSLTAALMAAAWQIPAAQNPVGTKALREPPPYWAYALNPPATAPAAAQTPDPTLRHVPGSEAAFTVEQTRNFFSPPDWHPAEHPAMPEIV